MQAESINAANQVGLDRPVLVGHSYGAAVAIAYEMKHPQEIAGRRGDLADGASRAAALAAGPPRAAAPTFPLRSARLAVCRRGAGRKLRAVAGCDHAAAFMGGDVLAPAHAAKLSRALPFRSRAAAAAHPRRRRGCARDRTRSHAQRAPISDLQRARSRDRQRYRSGDESGYPCAPAGAAASQCDADDPAWSWTHAASFRQEHVVRLVDDLRG